MPAHGDHDWRVTVRPASTALSPRRDVVVAFDLEGRPTSLFAGGDTYKRSPSSELYGRRTEGGTRRRWRVPHDRAAALLDRALTIAAEARTALRRGERLPGVEGAAAASALAERLDTVADWTPDRLQAERRRFLDAYAPIAILPPDQYGAVVLQPEPLHLLHLLPGPPVPGAADHGVPRARRRRPRSAGTRRRRPARRLPGRRERAGPEQRPSSADLRRCDHRVSGAPAGRLRRRVQWRAQDGTRLARAARLGARARRDRGRDRLGPAAGVPEQAGRRERGGELRHAAEGGGAGRVGHPDGGRGWAPIRERSPDGERRPARQAASHRKRPDLPLSVRAPARLGVRGARRRRRARGPDGRGARRAGPRASRRRARRGASDARGALPHRRVRVLIRVLNSRLGMSSRPNGARRSTRPRRSRPCYRPSPAEPSTSRSSST